MSDAELSPRVESLDVFVGLLSEVDAPGATGAFYDRVCEAMCRLTTMERAVLFLYDEALHRVRAEGGHGVEREVLRDVHGTLDETPVAQRALAEDRVVLASERLAEELPPRFARFLPMTTLTCTPVSAAGRWFGVIFADRGGGRFELSDPERHPMWMLGKLAALAASARIVTRQQERSRRLTDRIDLARDLHEGVVQRLFGVSLALGGEHELTPAERARASEEVETALAELRDALGAPLAPAARETSTTLREELERLRARYRELPVEVSWPAAAEVPGRLEPLAQTTLAEALRNAHKHASPRRVEVRVEAADGAFSLEVENDGAHESNGRPTGMGLRLAAFEALQEGGVLDFGPHPPDSWRVRLIVPSTVP